MLRRTFLQTGLACSLASPLLAELKKEGRFDKAALEMARLGAKNSVVKVASLMVIENRIGQGMTVGDTKPGDPMFLLGSISKPICITALMTLFDRGEFKLDDPLQKFLPQFTGDQRDKVTLRNLMSHVSGLPDQLPENNQLRQKHASLAEFVEHAARTPLSFAPGTRYQYSSMAILLASHVAEKITGKNILEFVDSAVFRPLGMAHSAIGLGRFKLEDFLPVQTEKAAPESGGGDPHAKDWDWNSPYWRKLGAPWGGVHASADDIGKFLSEFLHAEGKAVKPETAKLMLTNQNAKGLTPRGLGFNIGTAAGSPGCSEQTFGHTGSTGTLAWADPASQVICVVLTTLPGGAVKPHPRDVIAAEVAAAVK